MQSLAFASRPKIEAKMIWVTRIPVELNLLHLPWFRCLRGVFAWRNCIPSIWWLHAPWATTWFVALPPQTSHGFYKGKIKINFAEWKLFQEEWVNRSYRAKSSAVTGFGYASSMNSRTFSAVNGTTSNWESSNETVTECGIFVNVFLFCFERRLRSDDTMVFLVNRMNTERTKNKTTTRYTLEYYYYYYYFGCWLLSL